MIRIRLVEITGQRTDEVVLCANKRFKTLSASERRDTLRIPVWEPVVMPYSYTTKKKSLNIGLVVRKLI